MQCGAYSDVSKNHVTKLFPLIYPQARFTNSGKNIKGKVDFENICLSMQQSLLKYKKDFFEHFSNPCKDRRLC